MKGLFKMATKQEEAYKLSRELINNNDKIGLIKEKIKVDKENIKAYEERNVVVMGELRVHTEDDNINTDTY
ncbi:hypothetical protein DRH27_04960 [Candidatus Falkowbacteria bacterium]|nr:MAG: hypothetical protein DRH27_04960 [Candidatus Falkowbacteria bacterium]